MCVFYHWKSQENHFLIFKTPANPYVVNVNEICVTFLCGSLSVAYKCVVKGVKKLKTKPAGLTRKFWLPKFHGSSIHITLLKIKETLLKKGRIFIFQICLGLDKTLGSKRDFQIWMGIQSFSLWTGKADLRMASRCSGIHRRFLTRRKVFSSVSMRLKKWGSCT